MPRKTKLTEEIAREVKFEHRCGKTPALAWIRLTREPGRQAPMWQFYNEWPEDGGITSTFTSRYDTSDPKCPFCKRSLSVTIPQSSARPHAKLTEEIAREVKYGDWPVPFMAKVLGVTTAALYAIRKGKSWAWVKPLKKSGE